MSAKPEELPGMTSYTYRQTECVPITGMNNVKEIGQRPIVLLSTALITEDNLFMNGLFQNVYVLYRMFEGMGCLPIMFVNKKPETIDKIPKYMRDIRILCCEDLQRSPLPVKLHIEIGMSLDEGTHRFLKMCGAKICKLYLGNILNIDIENPIFMPSTHFAHHVKGKMDEIWVSPHYNQHSQYARMLNNVDPLGKAVVPYIWDPQILTHNGERTFQWKPAGKAEEDVFLVLEPNISFQKCSLVPLMILEAWFRKNPEWKGEVVLVNGERLLMIPFFRETIWNTLELVKAGRVKTTGRMDILTLLSKYPSAIPICHQWNNEYNYMVLEYFWCGFPVLHNASDWSSYGYYYQNSDLAAGVAQIEKVRSLHHMTGEVYKTSARSLAWRHSPYNPENQAVWAKIAGI